MSFAKIFGSCYHGNGRLNERKNDLFFFCDITHTVSKFERNLRPCVSNTYYKTLDDYRELILRINILHLTSFVIMLYGITSKKNHDIVYLAEQSQTAPVRMYLVRYIVD